VTTLAGGSRLLITGFQGPTGSQGPAGSIGSVGAIGEVQLSDGIGGLDSSSNLVYGSNTLVIASPTGTSDGFEVRNSSGVRTVGMDGDHLAISQRLAHDSDANTYMQFFTDQIEFFAGGQEFLLLNETTQNIASFNPNQGDIDFIVNGNVKLATTYDSGLDSWEFDSTDFHVNSLDMVLGNVNRGVVNTDFIEYRAINSAGFEELLIRMNNNSNGIVIGEFSGGQVTQLAINLNDSTNEITANQSGTVFNAGFKNRNFTIRKQTSGQAAVYNANLDLLTLDTVTAHTALRETVVNTTISESIDVETCTVISQDTAGITTTLTNVSTGSRIIVNNNSGGACTIGATILGTTNPTINDQESYLMFFNGTEWRLY
jgi:hypothetical protein